MSTWLGKGCRLTLSDPHLHLKRIDRRVYENKTSGGCALPYKAPGIGNGKAAPARGVAAKLPLNHKLKFNLEIVNQPQRKARSQRVTQQIYLRFSKNVSFTKSKHRHFIWKIMIVHFSFLILVCYIYNQSVAYYVLTCVSTWLGEILVVQIYICYS